MSAFDLLFKTGAKAGKKAAPFFSKADEVLEELQRGKGTGQEFLTELVKKGAKPTELRERGIEAALKDKPKMSKAQVKQVFEEKAPPKVQEKVLGDAPDYDEFLEAKAQEIYGVDWFDLSKEERKALDKMYGDLPSSQYEQYKTPGGENYREILLKLPQAKSEREIADENLKAFTDRVTSRIGKTGWDFDSMTPEELIEYDYLNKAALSASQTKPLPYASSHWKGEPNVLAHIRVQDFKTPEGKKVLLVDEIQSDWHQQGRKMGYATGDTTGWKVRGTNPENPSEVEVLNAEGKPVWSGTATGTDRQIIEKASKSGVPDAPFKKNWHELAMKRVLDYAAENGYDTVAITPGAEQAKRYDLSKHIDELIYSDDGSLYASKGGSKVFNERVPPERLADYVGKDAAEKLMSTQPNEVGSRVIGGLDLQIGGEGMKGFYDKILPDYLNTYGKQYGASVRQEPLTYSPSAQRIKQGEADDALLGQLGVETPAVPQVNYHKFDITPQMREAIKTKGQPLYSAMGAEGLAAGTGAATIGADALSGNNEQPVQNPVHFTENPDAMLLEMMQRN